MTHAFAVGYDWLFDYISQEDKEIIVNTTIKFGLDQGVLAYQQNAWWATGSDSRLTLSPHLADLLLSMSLASTIPSPTLDQCNWNLVCNGGLSIGALAFYDVATNQSALILDKAVAGLPISFSSYGPEGGWPEGDIYWGYGESIQPSLVDKNQHSSSIFSALVFLLLLSSLAFAP